MGEKRTKRDKTAQKVGSAAKDLRQQNIFAQTMAGRTAGEVASSMGMSRSQVSRVLNSEDVKAKISEIDRKLAGGLDDAIATVLKEVKFSYPAARDLLRGFGALKIKFELAGKITLEELVLESMVKGEGDEKDSKK